MPVLEIIIGSVCDIEDEIAIQWDAFDSLVQIELFLRALRRRGFIHTDDWNDLEKHLDRAFRGNSVIKNALREARQKTIDSDEVPED